MRRRAAALLLCMLHARELEGPLHVRILRRAIGRRLIVRRAEISAGQPPLQPQPHAAAEAEEKEHCSRHGQPHRERPLLSKVWTMSVAFEEGRG